MARRFVGQAVIDVRFDHAVVGDRWYYHGRISVKATYLKCGRTTGKSTEIKDDAYEKAVAWESFEFGSPVGGFGPGVACDSSEAYDQMAASVAQFASYYTSGNRKNADRDGDTEGYPTGEQADAFHDALVEAMGDDKGRLEVRRTKTGPMRLVS